MESALMRLIMLGTGPFAVPTFRSLATSRHDIALVVTRPARGRSRPSDNPMLREAHELGVDAWAPPTVNAPEAVERLSSLAADLLVVCDYGEILKPATLAVTRLGGINLHGSLLPKYRGAAPVQWAILNGDTETGSSVIQMTPRLDAGPCLAQEATRIDPEEDAAVLESRLAAIGASLVCKVVDQLAAGNFSAIEQDPSLASKAPRLGKEDGHIDWSATTYNIKNRVRALVPWPRAYTFWQRSTGELLRLNIDRVRVVEETEPSAAAPGTVIQSDARLVVLTGNGALELLDVQPAGKRRMSAAEFLRGYRLQVGDRLGPGK